MMPDYRRRLQHSPTDYEGWYEREDVNAKVPLSNTDSGYYSASESYHGFLPSPAQHDSSRDTLKTQMSMLSASDQRRRWPPQPSVEDEETSLAKELGSSTLSNPSAPKGGEMLVRGAIDQQPIILEAGAPIRSPTSDASQPPWAVSENPERRFVYIPSQEEHTLERNDNPPKESANKAATGRERKEHPRLDSAPRLDHTPNQYTERKPSPYAISGDRMSGEYVMSPDILTPAREYPSTSRRRHGSFSSKDWPNEKLSEGTGHGYIDTASHQENTRPRRRSFRNNESTRTSQDSSRSDYDEDSKSQEHLLRQSCLKNPPTENFKADRYSPSLPSRSRPSSRHASPTASPLSSPPRSPKLKPTNDQDSYLPNGGARSRRGTNTGSRPASPLPSRYSYSPRSSRHDTTDDGNPRGSEHTNGRRSQPTSPLLSPTHQRSDPSSGPRIDIHSPSPLPHRSGLPQPQLDSSTHRPLPSPTSPRRVYNPPYPDGPHHWPSLDPQLPPRSPSASYVDRESRHLTNEKLTPRSASFAASDRKPDRPRSSEPTTRSPSYPHQGTQHRQNVHVLNAPPSLPSRLIENPQSPGPHPRQTSFVAQKNNTELPPCPRSRYIKGYDDWSTLNGIPSFDICPSCVQAAMVHSRYRHHFVRSPPRDPATPIKCDFSSPWVRHAWALTLKQQRPSLDLVYGVAKVETTEVPCPGNAGAVAPWSHLIDPSTGRPVPNFDICPYCVRNAEASMPSLRGAFVRTYLSDPMMPRVCDLRSDSRRFSNYVALLEAATTKAEAERRAPDLRTFADHARTRASLRECSRDDMVLSQGWHVMPHIPQFTVCEECYHDVIWPAVTKGSQLAGRFNRTLQHVGALNQGVSCQLYSPRMRWVFGEAAERNDLEGLRRVVMERVSMEAMLQGKHKELQGRLAMHESLHGYRREGEREKEAIIEEIAGIAEEWKKWE